MSGHRKQSVAADRGMRTKGPWTTKTWISVPLERHARSAEDRQLLAGRSSKQTTDSRRIYCSYEKAAVWVNSRAPLGHRSEVFFWIFGGRLFMYETKQGSCLPRASFMCPHHKHKYIALKKAKWCYCRAVHAVSEREESGFVGEGNQKPCGNILLSPFSVLLLTQRWGQRQEQLGLHFKCYPWALYRETRKTWAVLLSSTRMCTCVCLELF